MKNIPSRTTLSALFLSREACFLRSLLLMGMISITALSEARSQGEPLPQEGSVESMVQDGYTYQEWTAFQDLPPEAAGPVGSVTDDGVPNILKFAFGMGARDLSRDAFPKPRFISEAGSLYLAVEFVRDPRALGVEFHLEGSDDLVRWERVEAPLIQIEQTEEGLDRVELKDVAPAGFRESRFLRVRVQLDEHVGYTPASGGELEVFGPDGQSLATGNVGEAGRYRIRFEDDQVPESYRLVLRGGTIDGVAFEGELSALYAREDSTGQINLTLLTTLVDALAMSDPATGQTALQQRNAAIARLSNIGMISPQEWAMASPQSARMDMLWQQVRETGSVQAWTGAIVADLADDDLSPEWMNGFPMAHGGVLKAGASGEAFQNRLYLGHVEVDSALSNEQDYIYQLATGPEDLSLSEDGTVEMFVTPDASVGELAFSFWVINAGTGKGRHIDDSIYVMETEVVAEGMVGPEGGRVSDDWDEVVLRVPGPGGVSAVGEVPEGIELLAPVTGVDGNLYALSRTGEINDEFIQVHRFDGLDWSVAAELHNWADYLGNAGLELENLSLQLTAGSKETFQVWLTAAADGETAVVEVDATTGLSSLLFTAGNIQASSAVSTPDGQIYVAGYSSDSGPARVVYRYDRAQNELVETSTLDFDDAGQEPSSFGSTLRLLTTGDSTRLFACNVPRASSALKVFAIDLATGQTELLTSLPENGELDFDDIAVGEDGAVYLTGFSTAAGRRIGFLDELNPGTLERSRIADINELPQSDASEDRQARILAATEGNFIIEVSLDSGSDRMFYHIQAGGAVQEETLFQVLRGVQASGQYAYAVRTDPREVEILQPLALATPDSLLREIELEGQRLLARQGVRKANPGVFASVTTGSSIWNETATFLTLNHVLTIRDIPTTNRLPADHRDLRFNWLLMEVFSAESSLLELVLPGQSLNYEEMVPVVFVHGYKLGGELGGGKDTWGDFLDLLAEIQAGDGGKRYLVSEFRYKSNARFQDIAADFGKAIGQVQRLTGKPVHIIAHSFGGLVARTYLQGLAEGVDYNQNVASLVTLSTPHCGIFPEEATRFDRTFPDGTDGIGGNFWLKRHGQISAYQAGAGSRRIYSYDRSPYGLFTDRVDLREPMGLSKEPGWVVGQLAELEGEKTRLPPVPILSLIGLSWESKSRLDIPPPIIATFGDSLVGLSSYRIKPSSLALVLARQIFELRHGDGLISFRGQRFHPSLPYPESSPITGLGGALLPATVQEKVLHRPAYLPGEWLYADHISSPRGPEGYIHNGASDMASAFLLEGELIAKVISATEDNHRAYAEILNWLDEHADPEMQAPVPEFDLFVKVVDAETEEPLDEAKVTLHADGQNYKPEAESPGGRFNFVGIPFRSGITVTLYANQEGYHRNIWNAALGAEPPQEPFDAGTIPLQLDEPGRGGFRLTVSDLSGQRIPGASWLLLRSGGGQLDRGYTDAAGEAFRSGIARGSYEIQVSKPGGSAVGAQLIILPEETAEVHIQMRAQLLVPVEVPVDSGGEIPPGMPWPFTEFEFTVNESFTVQGLTLTLAIAGDTSTDDLGALAMVLYSPNDTRVDLTFSDDLGDNGHEREQITGLRDVRFEDGFGPIDEAEPTFTDTDVGYFTGTYDVTTSVVGDLSAFNGENSIGTWILEVTDHGGRLTTGATLFAPGSDNPPDWGPTSGTVLTLVRDEAAPPGTETVAPAGMALISGGEFEMGDSFNEGNSDERPVHTVDVSAFYMDRYEVTKALWDEVRAWGVDNGYTDLPAGGGKAADHPVDTVSWYDVVKWCNARSEKDELVPAYYTSAAQTAVYRTGQVDVQNDWVKWDEGYRLPTEAEWEKAARGGSSGRRFPWGDTDNITHSRANYYSTERAAYDISSTRGYHPAFNDGFSPYTSPVGHFTANGYGLYDMAGNVWEWCWDWYGSTYYTSSPGTNPKGPLTREVEWEEIGSVPRVYRGGSWAFDVSNCRVAARNQGAPPYGWGGDHIGFRTVLSQDQP